MSDRGRVNEWLFAETAINGGEKGSRSGEAAQPDYCVATTLSAAVDRSVNQAVLGALESFTIAPLTLRALVLLNI